MCMNSYFLDITMIATSPDLKGSNYGIVLGTVLGVIAFILSLTCITLMSVCFVKRKIKGLFHM